MKISFDLDDTLIMSETTQVSSEKLINGEVLRKGTIKLLLELQKSHELWIYTTSFRTPWVIKWAFRLKGIKIFRVINQTEHMELMKQLNLVKSPTKFPSQFGIDLHIDDSLGVKQEGQDFGFNVLRVDLIEEKWTEFIFEYFSF